MISLFILLTGQGMAVMDGSILVVASPSLRADLHASSAELQLIVTAYTLAFAAVVITGARLGAICGHRRVFRGGLAVFTLASLLAGLAPDAAFLIGARTLQGAAAALMTPQVLSLIQAQFDGERRARALGAYSMILAVGVAVGQILGGIIITLHLLAAAWRPALLINAPVGTAVLLASRRSAGQAEPGTPEQLDIPGAGLLATALLALVVPVTFGRQYNWPLWVWPCLAGCVLAACAFIARERGLQAAGRRPLVDLSLFRRPGVGTGVASVLLIMAGYAGFLLTLTLYLQGAHHFTALHAGSIFAIYALGFASASLSWTRFSLATRARMPVLGPLAMGGALLGVGLLGGHGNWPTLATAPLLLVAGAGHALGFAPLTNRLTTAIGATQATDLSGLLLTASLIGQVVGVAALTDIYLSVAARHPGRALTVTTAALAATLAVSSASARSALRNRPGGLAASEPRAEQPAPVAPDQPSSRGRSW